MQRRSIMKMFGRIGALLLCVALLVCGAVTVGADAETELDLGTVHFYGYENYPLDTPIRYLCFEDIDRTASYVGWYKEYAKLSDSHRVEYLSRLWYCNTVFEDGIAWPAEYLDHFESLLKNAAGSEDGKCRVDGYRWDNNRLSVDVSADLSADDGYVFVLAVIVDKADGNAVYMGEADGVCLGVSAKSLSFDIVMPAVFDPAKHGVELYFCSHGEDESAEDPVFFGRYEISARDSRIPYPAREMIGIDFTYAVGDVNRDVAVNLADVSLTLKCIADWGVDVESALADVNGDGGVNLSDVSEILKLIAGWNA